MITVTIHRATLEKHNACSEGLALYDAIAARVRVVGECWEWQGALSGSGYGRVRRGGRNHQAHRLMYTAVHGPIAPKVVVCHRCDNRRCVRPDHLFAGSASDNMQDCARKGRVSSQRHPERLPRGERHPHARLTLSAVRSIRTALSAGTSARALARAHGVSDRTIRNIRDGRKWRDTEARDAAE